MTKQANSIARRVRLAALWVVVRGLRGKYRQGMPEIVEMKPKLCQNPLNNVAEIYKKL